MMCVLCGFLNLLHWLMHLLLVLHSCNCNCLFDIEGPVVPNAVISCKFFRLGGWGDWCGYKPLRQKPAKHGWNWSWAMFFFLENIEKILI